MVLNVFLCFHSGITENLRKNYGKVRRGGILLASLRDFFKKIPRFLQCASSSSADFVKKESTDVHKKLLCVFIRRGDILTAERLLSFLHGLLVSSCRATLDLFVRYETSSFGIFVYGSHVSLLF